jgi:hypothetical protein
MMMSTRAHLAALAVLFAVSLAYCTAAVLDGPSRHHDDPAFDALRQVDIVPGEGLGELRVGELTLRTCVERFGPGHAALLAGDDYRIELSYLGRALVLTFFVGTVQEVDIPFEHLKRTVLGDLPDMVVSQVVLGAAELTDLRLAPRSYDLEHCMLRGRVAGLVPLGGDPRPLREALGAPRSEVVLEERREDLDDDGVESADEVVFERRREVHDGLLLEWTRERGATPRLVSITVRERDR